MSSQPEQPLDTDEKSKPSEEPPKEEPKIEKKSILDFIKPEVAQQLQDMGFSKNVSEKACLFTQSNIEAAVEWISSHQNDPDFEEPAQIEVSAEPPKPKMSKEEAAIKAKELQEKMRKIHEEKQKEIDREHERLRIQKHRRQVLEEIERDKAERMGKKYVPPEQKQKVYTKEENIQYFIKTIKTVYNPFRAADTLKNCFKTLKIILSNIIKNPNEDKFKTIKLSNPNVHERIGNISIALKLLEELGFQHEDEIMKVTNIDTDLFNKTIGYLENELSQLE